MRLKSWYKVVQEDHIGQLWSDLERTVDTEGANMMLESSLADTIKMTGSETSGNSFPEKIIMILLALSLAQGGL